MTTTAPITADDATLARAWAAGDEAAFEALVTRWAPVVYARCRRALGAADADDATQAVFLVLARRRAPAAAARVFAAWLLTTADFVVANARRDRRRRRETAPSTTTLASAEPAVDDLQDHLDACLAQLPAPEREAVRLHHLAGKTLAEVAGLLGVPLSTVHDRVQRGLARLRPLLERRGVQAAGIAVLLAGLTAPGAAAAEVPADLLARLQGLPSAGGVAAASARAVRWARPAAPALLRCAVGGALLLLVAGGAAVALRSGGDSGAGPASTAAPVRPMMAAAPAADGTPVAPPPPAAAVPSSRDWVAFRWHDGARTAERLRGLPEVALLGAAAEPTLAAVADIAEATLLFEPMALLPPAQRERLLAEQRTLERLTPAEREARVLAATDDSEQGEALRATMGVDRTRGAHAEVTAPEADVEPVAALAGWARMADAAAVERVLARLDGAVATPEGWALGGGAAQLRREAQRLVLTGSLLAPDAAMQATSAAPGRTDADLEIVLWRAVAGAAPERRGGVDLTVRPDGLRLTSRFAWEDEQQGRDAAAAPRLARDCLDAVPAGALVAGAWRLAPAGTAMGRLLVHRLTAAAVPPELATTVRDAAMRIDGTLLVWVESGAPVPALTGQIELPADAAETLLAATGLPRGADGSVAIQLGLLPLVVGWRDGRLVATTLPGGLDAIDRRGGFTAHDDVRRALAAMPEGPLGGCAVLRPRALVDTVAPYVAMAGAAWNERLLAYDGRLQDGAYAFLAVASDAGGLRIDAAGVLSLIAGAALAGIGAEMMPQRTAN